MQMRCYRRRWRGEERLNEKLVEFGAKAHVEVYPRYGCEENEWMRYKMSQDNKDEYERNVSVVLCRVPARRERVLS